MKSNKTKELFVVVEPTETSYSKEESFEKLAPMNNVPSTRKLMTILEE